MRVTGSTFTKTHQTQLLGHHHPKTFKAAFNVPFMVLSQICDKKKRIVFLAFSCLLHVIVYYAPITLAFKLLFTCMCTKIQWQLESDMFCQILMQKKKNKAQTKNKSHVTYAHCRTVDIVLRVVPTFTNLIIVEVYKNINIAG